MKQASLVLGTEPCSPWIVESVACGDVVNLDVAVARRHRGRTPRGSSVEETRSKPLLVTSNKFHAAKYSHPVQDGALGVLSLFTGLS